MVAVHLELSFKKGLAYIFEAHPTIRKFINLQFTETTSLQTQRPMSRMVKKSQFITPNRCDFPENFTITDKSQCFPDFSGPESFTTVARTTSRRASSVKPRPNAPSRGRPDRRSAGADRQTAWHTVTGGCEGWDAPSFD